MAAALRDRIDAPERWLYQLPTVCIAASAVAIAWRHDGSVLASDWLPYAALITLVLAALLSSSAFALSPFPLACAALVVGFGVWTAISASWSPVPSLARDEFLLCSLYGFTIVLQARGIRAESDRITGIAIVVLALGASAVAVAASARLGDDPESLYVGGRLVAPISYVNAAAAFFLVGLWPALVLAARRELHPLLRGTALAAGAAMLAGWLGTQSKGGAIALAVSAIVVFCVVPGRLRLLVPTALTAALVLSQYDTLTEPFRAQDDVDAIRRAARGLARDHSGRARHRSRLRTRRQPAADRQARPPSGGDRGRGPRCARSRGRIRYAADRRVDDRSTFVQDQWESFKRSRATESGSSHLVNLGSNRYDFWRVSLAGFEEHPLAGIGGRGFGPRYLQYGDSNETPARAHSLPLDALLETGVVGLMLLLAAFAAILAGLVRQLGTAAGAAAFGALVYFAVHAAGDWVWTFPAVGLPLFALVGLALAPVGGRALAGRRGGIAAAAVAVFALVAFTLPWLSSRVTSSVLTGEAEVGTLRWARALDPLAVEPYLAEAAVASGPEEAIPPLERAVEKEPRAVGHRYLLGNAYLEAGQADEALAQLAVANELFPGDEDIRKALAEARRAAG